MTRGPERPPQRRPPQRRPPRLIEYHLPDGWLALVGRSDADNDRLSLEVARPMDYWFHVRGMSGGHVVLRAREDAEPDRRTLDRAASLAVWHSRARAGGSTPVTCTRAAHVSKPAGSPAGTVAVRRETMRNVRPPEPEDVARWAAGPS